MYHEVEDKEFLRKMRQFCGEMMQKLCRELKDNYDIGAVPVLIGSGASNFILQNADEPIDLDYNLVINKNTYSGNGKDIKDAFKDCFNIVLRAYKLDDCNDSTSCLTSKLIILRKYPHIKFSIDVAIIDEDEDGSWYRLIHNKYKEEYYWNKAPNKLEIKEKEAFIKERNGWQAVHSEYKHLKNLYLSLNYQNRSSSVLYIESVNNVYNHLKQSDVCNLASRNHLHEIFFNSYSVPVSSLHTPLGRYQYTSLIGWRR